MSVRSRILSCGVLACLSALAAIAPVLAPPADARGLEDHERSTLASTVDEFNTAMRNDNYERIIATVPPKMVEVVAKKVQLPVSEVRTSMVSAMRNVTNSVKIESFSMDVGKAEYQEANGGEPYALIPTETVLAADGQRYRVKSKTLALLDGATWYLVRVGEPSQVVVLRSAYPQFAGIEFSEGVMEALN